MLERHEKKITSIFANFALSCVARTHHSKSLTVTEE